MAYNLLINGGIEVSWGYKSSKVEKCPQVTAAISPVNLFDGTTDEFFKKVEKTG